MILGRGATAKLAHKDAGGVIVEYAVVLAFLSLLLIAGAILVTNAVNAYWPLVADAF